MVCDIAESYYMVIAVDNNFIGGGGGGGSKGGDLFAALFEALRDVRAAPKEADPKQMAIVLEQQKNAAVAQQRAAKLRPQQ